MGNNLDKPNKLIVIDKLLFNNDFKLKIANQIIVKLYKQKIELVSEAKLANMLMQYNKGGYNKFFDITEIIRLPIIIQNLLISSNEIKIKLALNLIY